MDNEENEVIDLTEILSAVRQHLLELIFVTLRWLALRRLSF